MMKNKTLMKTFLLSGMAGIAAFSAYGATIIQPHADGYLSGNFTNVDSGDITWTTPGTDGLLAVGLHPDTASGWGILGHGDTAQLWEISFTPGANGDPSNFSPEAGTPLTNPTRGTGELATGISHSSLTDGQVMDFRVFATWAWSTHPSSPTTFAILDSGGATLDSVTLDQRPDDTWSGVAGGEGNRFINGWGLLTTVSMTAGEAYTLAISSPEGGTYSQILTGVMFEPIPEPSTYAAIFGSLALLGAFVYRRRQSAKR